MLQPLKTSPELPGPHTHLPLLPTDPKHTPQGPTVHKYSQDLPQTAPQSSSVPVRACRPLKNTPLLALPPKQAPGGPLPLRPPTASHRPPPSNLLPITPHFPQSPPQTPLPSASSHISRHKTPRSPPPAPLLDLAELLALAERLEGEALVALGAGVQRRHPAAPLTGAARPPSRPARAAPPPTAAHWSRAASFTPQPLLIGERAVTHSRGAGRAEEALTSRGAP